MVAEPSVQKITTALAGITSGTENIGIAISSLQHDLEGDGALPGLNHNLRVIESIGVQVATNFEQVKQIVDANIDMARNIDRLLLAAQGYERDKASYAQISSAVTEQIANVFGRMPAQERQAKQMGIDGKEASIAANAISMLGKDRHDYVDWNSKVINAMAWVNRHLGREMKEAPNG